ncbi:MAG: hypothetical protein OEW04_10045 [Nitrospirota bacterium]|nr:hypothetical protein [Nitrospirota bacterium]
MDGDEIGVYRSAAKIAEGLVKGLFNCKAPEDIEGIILCRVSSSIVAIYFSPASLNLSYKTLF